MTDNRAKAVPTVVVNALVARFKSLFAQYPQMSFLAITGNHDQATKNLRDVQAVSALEYLATVFEDRFLIVDNQAIWVDDQTILAGIPYYEYPEHFEEKLVAMSAQVAVLKAKREGVKAYLMMHQTPSGMEGVYAMIPADVSPSNPAFEPFDLVLDGHIHGRMQLTSKFLVGGSPIHKDLGDEGEDKGFHVIDTAEVAFVFFSLNKKFPVYMRRTEGAELELHERGQYVVFTPAFAPVPEADVKAVEEFKADNTATDLITNFWTEVDGKDEELLKVGLSFIPVQEGAI